MSFETRKITSAIPTPTPEDIKAALELIEEDEDLSQHPRVKALIARDFITEDNIQLDPGNFLVAVKNALAREQITETPEAYSDRIERIMSAMVTHSQPTR